MRTTEIKIAKAILKLRLHNEKATQTRVALELGISRENISRRYGHLFKLPNNELKKYHNKRLRTAKFRMQNGAFQTHQKRKEKSQLKIIKAIFERELKKQKVTKLGISQDISLSRTQISTQYSHMFERENIINVSAGKDSTALLLFAIENDFKFKAVFSDTGNEHEETLNYLNYLEHRLGIKIKKIKANFEEFKFSKKREYIQTVWREEGIAENKIENALRHLYKRGNPFLDLCLLKGRFPSTKARFCSEELKHKPIWEQVIEPLISEGKMVLSWQGIRKDESKERMLMSEFEYSEPRLMIVRPIINWDVKKVFDIHNRHNIKPNPLYKKGMSRVGCMPCIHSVKEEIRQINLRFPDEIERIREWEKIISYAGKRGGYTFFSPDKIPGTAPGRAHIDAVIDWSQTLRGGKERDPKAQIISACSSLYGLCE